VKKYTLFSGCMISTKLPFIEALTLSTLRKMDVGVITLKDWSCCPEPTMIRMLSEKAWYSLAARNISIAEEGKCNILTLCNGCLMTLLKANEDIKENSDLRREMNAILGRVGRDFKGIVEVKSLWRFLYEDIGPKKLKALIQKPLVDFRVAIHYGCHMMEELKLYDNTQDPKALRELVKILGADVVDYPDGLKCCGYPLSPIDRELSIDEAAERLRCVDEAQANCLCVLCPACYLQFRLALHKNRQPKVKLAYYPELLGSAMGILPNLHQRSREDVPHRRPPDAC